MSKSKIIMPWERAAPIELGLHGALTWKEVKPGYVQFGIQEGAVERASVVIDRNQGIELMKSLAEIWGIRVRNQENLK